jgi:hypothetical protein
MQRANPVASTGMAVKGQDERWRALDSHTCSGSSGRQEMNGIISIIQNSWYLIHAARSSGAVVRAVRLGLRKTSATGCQLRIDPVQRSGWRLRALS